MKAPKRLEPLVEDGFIDEVISRLMSGKEADIFIVRCAGEQRCAKVYKEAAQRSFKKAAQYQEGRKVRSGRRARAMEKGSSFGKQEIEKIWQRAEVDALSLLESVGVRVPKTYGCIDGVLIMELIVDDQGEVAPRLDDLAFDQEQALEDHATMMHYIKLMLCAGLVHGDLSEFNVLVDQHGPVIIDLPQAVNASANNNARTMLIRDVNNMTRYYGQFATSLLDTHYAEEMWELYEAGELKPETKLSGYFDAPQESADVDAVLEEIKAAIKEEEARLERLRAAEED